jgi:hypothetical protein
MTGRGGVTRVDGVQRLAPHVERVRLALVVSPRLLCEALARVLSDRDIDMTVIPGDAVLSELAWDQDVIITTRDLPRGASAPLVLQVGNDGGLDLDELLRRLDGLLMRGRAAEHDRLGRDR